MRRYSILFFIVSGLYSCEPISERKQPPPSLLQLAANQDMNLSGKQLADAYCGSCHIAPEPSDLDRRTWVNSVLPDMRMRMGLIIPEDFGRVMPSDMDVPDGVYSKVALINKTNWEKLKAHYLENAPDVPLPQESKIAPTRGLPIFKEIRPEFSASRADLTTLLSIHPDNGDVYLGHRFKSLFILDASKNFEVKDSISTNTAPVHIRFSDQPDQFELLTMGIMDPSNDSLGRLSKFNFQDSWVSSEIEESLIRPVHASYADWNADGVEDRVICHFGDHVGKLSLYLSDGDSFREIILKALPGSRKTIPVDIDNDGDLDILGAMTQSNEGIFLWVNEGEGVFVEQRLLGFQPSHGLSDFSFEDMNGDGFDDLITVNGDNADKSQILKNYHGVRIFLNDGKNSFEESWFYPIHGATGLEVADFDLDGDMDLFTLAFFPDRNQGPSESLIYFSQSAQMEFDPFIPAIETKNKWLTMTKGDLGMDGDLDLIVGEFDFDELYQAPKDNWKPILIFENVLK